MWTHWVGAILGLWLVVSPFVPGTTHPAHNVVLGVLVAAVALLGIRSHRAAEGPEPAPGPRPTPPAG